MYCAKYKRKNHTILYHLKKTPSVFSQHVYKNIGRNKIKIEYIFLSVRSSIYLPNANTKN